MLNNEAQKVYRREQQIPLMPFRLENTTILLFFSYNKSMRQSSFSFLGICL